jgi:hypothetical protein
MRKPRRHQPSTIDRLDPEIKKLIDTLRVDHGWSIDEIRARLIEIGQGHVSRSALGRHVRRLEDVQGELREVEVYARALGREVGAEEDAKMLSLNTMMLQKNMFKLTMAERDGEPVQFDTKESKEFSEALRNISIARKNELDTEEKAEARGARRERLRIAAAVKEIAKRPEAGLSKETRDAIFREILKVG